jgi:hypothetical protein
MLQQGRFSGSALGDSHGRLAAVTDTVAQVLGRPPLTFEHWAQQNVAARYFQDLWISEFQATSDPVFEGSASDVSGVMSMGAFEQLAFVECRAGTYEGDQEGWPDGAPIATWASCGNPRSVYACP